MEKLSINKVKDVRYEGANPGDIVYTFDGASGRMNPNICVARTEDMIRIITPDLELVDIER